ncbi:uncharacterized protein LOC127708334 [Mytilus californianus]|uniref:uncharacterized protein LOC127708334 n=1 Tax=Mytilus californianus TaxID=6549 RepID=UPI0022460B24|nr:uncharacterized protein LOC127708334 [Mytilus californianus]
MLPSTTTSSEYGKENMNVILKSRNENTCDNSPDQYASSVPGIYDVLHDKRHKTDNGEQFDRMFELKSLPENRNETHPIHLENSRRGGYESVVIDGELPVISSENNGNDYDDLEIVTQHNKEYMHNQKQEEENRNKSPVQQETVEYAQVNEATKFKNKTKHNDKDQPTLDANAETQEMINIKSEERIQKHDENADQFDTTNNGKNHDEADSSLKDSQRACNIKTFAHGGEGKTKVARVCPSIRSLARSEDYKQQGNTNAEIQDEINDISGQTVHNDEYVDITENLRKQQTNGDLESSNKYNQIGSYINPEFERKEYQEVDSDSPPCRSFHGLQDEGQIHQNSDKQPNNDNEKVHI